MRDIDWRDLILAYLHDPPDKALDLRTHESRAREYAAKALGETVTQADLEAARSEDIKASVEDRLPLPRYQPGKENRLVEFVGEKTPDYAFRVHHPLSGAVRILAGVDRWQKDLSQAPAVKQLFGRILGLDHKQRLFALWRFLPDAFAGTQSDTALLPADTRVPDHTIWNHLDLTAAFKSALADGRGGCLLSFTLGPVQSFVEQARSLRDLWSGSFLLSWLALHSLVPIVNECGPSSVVFPGLRGNALFDWWMTTEFGTRHPFGGLLPASARNDLLVGSLPNTFLALVPRSQAEELAVRVEEACKNAWLEIASAVHESLENLWGKNPEWDVGWQDQIHNHWDVRVCTLPLRPAESASREALKAQFEQLLWTGCWPSSAIGVLEKLLRDSGAGYPNDASTGSWAMQVELCGRLMAASKQIRNVSPPTAAGGDRPKCSVMGSLEQMGPGGSEKAQREFWQRVSALPLRGTRIQSNERLCAIALVKRFCWPAFFSTRLRLNPTELRYSDTATLAATEWLRNNRIDPNQVRREHNVWNGQWLFQPASAWTRQSEHDDQDSPPVALREALREARQDAEKPCAYYAVFALDGDEMGKWLRGENAPTLEKSYHPKLAAYFQGLDPSAKESLEARRPLSPALHAALTQALGNYARYVVRGVVEDHDGELVYAGGDDVLALSPIHSALPCLRALTREYQKDWGEHGGRPMLLLGRNATMSAGLAIAHHKSDLRDAVGAAREAEKTAKQAGRNALGIAVLKRSGEHAMLVIPWTFVPRLERLVSAFRSGASDRWAYHLRAEAETLETLDEASVAAVLRQTVNHGDSETCARLKEALGSADDAEAGDAVAATYAQFRRECLAGSSEVQAARELCFKTPFTQFVMLTQAASFLARGRDD